MMNTRQPIERLLPFAPGSVLFAVTLFVTPCEAAITEKKDSWDFGTYRYEMGRLPTAVDLDGNGTNDFVLNGLESALTVTNGLLTLVTPAAGSAYHKSNTAGSAWRALEG